MAPLFGLVADLTPGKSKFFMKLKVIRSYRVPQLQNRHEAYSHEVVFHDKEGRRVHGSIDKLSIPAFENSVKEGKVYAMMNFVVAHNTMRTKTTTCPYKIMLFKHTRIVESVDDTFPNHLMNLKSFEDIIASEPKPEAALFDVMGMIIKSSKAEDKMVNGKMTRQLDMIIEDLEHKTLKCTVWEGYADQVDEYVKRKTEAGDTSPIAVLLKFCRKSIFRGETKVTNSYHVTQILFDEVAEIQKMHESFIESDKGQSTMEIIPLPRARTVEDEINEGECMLKPISELRKYQSGKFWVCGKICAVETIGAWNYLACKLCFKKLKKDDAAFYCDACETFDVMGRRRYRLHISIYDDSDFGKFIMWDRECSEIVGKAAADLSVDETDPILPFDFELLRNKTALFKIIIKQHELELNKGAYLISKVSCDPELIAKYGDASVKEIETNDAFPIDSDTFTAWEETLKRSAANEAEDEEVPVVFKRSKKVQALKERVEGEQ